MDVSPSTPDEAVQDELSFRGEVRRKALHLLALVVPLFMAWAGRELSLWVMLPLSLLAVTGDVLRARAPLFRRFIDRSFGFMMRKSERPPLHGPIRINGATWVLISAVLLTFVFPIQIAVPAFAAFMVADAAAALVGRRWGKTKWGPGPRTVEGSGAFVVTGIAAMALFPSVSIWTACITAPIGAVAEIFPRPFNDNLRVPFVMAAVLYLLG